MFRAFQSYLGIGPRRFLELKRLYQLLGAEANIALFTGPTGHGFSQENREAMYRWFNQATGVSDQQQEPEIQLEKDTIEPSSR